MLGSTHSHWQNIIRDSQIIKTQQNHCWSMMTFDMVAFRQLLQSAFSNTIFEHHCQWYWQKHQRIQCQHDLHFSCLFLHWSSLTKVSIAEARMTYIYYLRSSSASSQRHLPVQSHTALHYTVICIAKLDKKQKLEPDISKSVSDYFLPFAEVSEVHCTALACFGLWWPVSVSVSVASEMEHLLKSAASSVLATCPATCPRS